MHESEVVVVLAEGINEGCKEYHNRTKIATNSFDHIGKVVLLKTLNMSPDGKIDLTMENQVWRPKPVIGRYVLGYDLIHLEKVFILHSIIPVHDL